MKLFIATDHTGFVLKEKLKTVLSEKGYDVEDCGAYTYDLQDDYPDVIVKAARGVAADPEHTLGIILGGSGQGEAMVANKVPGIRCALFYQPALPVQAVDAEGQESTDPFEILKLTRRHNWANMLSLGVRFLSEEDILKAITLWLATPQPDNARHLRRVEKIMQLDKK